MNTPHTPGKWRVIPNVFPPQLKGFLIEQDGAPIAHVPLVSLIPGRDEANAALIARAPELLAQRDALKAALEDLINQPTWNRNLAPRERDSLDKARAALTLSQEAGK